MPETAAEMLVELDQTEAIEPQVASTLTDDPRARVSPWRHPYATGLVSEVVAMTSEE